MNLQHEFIKMSNMCLMNKLAGINVFINIVIHTITMRDFCTVILHGLQYTTTIYILNFFVYLFNYKNIEHLWSF